jgi:hypothetical protein
LVSTRALTLLLLIGAACAPRAAGERERRVEDVLVDGVRLRILYLSEDAAAARVVREALPQAVARARRFGVLAEPVTITVHPDHAALEAAVHRRGIPWLRAWARYRTIDLQSPRTWGWLRASRRRIGELVAHELTHCATYQASGDAADWLYRPLPRWFVEGVASVAAGQGHRWSDPRALARHYRAAAKAPPGAGAAARAGDADPLAPADSLLADRHDLVYGAAHHAVSSLVSSHGDEAVRRVLAGIRAGGTFEEAFADAVGMTPAAFTDDFRRRVHGERRPHP